MKFGVTGTRVGMTDEQRAAFRNWIEGWGEILLEEFHHGSCQGVDVEAARIVRELVPACYIVAHPGPDGDPCQESSGVDNETRPPLTHFARNRNIVNETDWLAALPRELERQPRGGTWYTVGYAEKSRKPLALIWPNGGVYIPAVAR